MPTQKERKRFKNTSLSQLIYNNKAHTPTRAPPKTLMATLTLPALDGAEAVGRGNPVLVPADEAVVSPAVGRRVEIAMVLLEEGIDGAMVAEALAVPLEAWVLV